MKKHLVLLLATFYMMLLIGSSVRLERDNGNILIDASKPQMIISPCKIDYVGENGEKGFRIGPKVSSGWRDRSWNIDTDKNEGVKANGLAIYNFYVPADGEYTLWGYTLWGDSCTNAIFVKIDQGENFILGNDPIYKKWHWVRGVTRNLSKGSHKLTLSNHSNDVALQKIILIGSKYKLPSSCDSYFTDVFYDDFDGCDLGNFEQWKKVRGKWFVSNYDKLISSKSKSLLTESCVYPDSQNGVVGTHSENNIFDISFEGNDGSIRQGEVNNNPTSASELNNSLIGRSTEKSSAEIKVDASIWENYSFDIDLSFKKYNDASFAQFCFGMEGTQSFAVKFIPNMKGQFVVQLMKKKGKEVFILGESIFDKNDFTLSMNNEKEMILLLDGKPAIRIESHKYQGGISIILGGNIIACFDNLHIRYLKSLP